MKLSTLTHFDEQDIYFLFGMEILISDQKLSAAIDQLSDTRKKIVLLYKFNDTEIDKILNISMNGFNEVVNLLPM